METRGEKSAGAKLAAVVVLPVGPMQPPAELTAGQAQTWTLIVSSKPPGWFADDSAQLLIAYCIAVERRRMISEEIERLLVPKRKRYARITELLEIERRQVSTISALSRGMRLSQQSRYTPQKAATEQKAQPPGIRPPWVKGA